jgi:hypothetical protein
MSCEHELRCLNKDKCYRCFGESLLKLPEDKARKSKAKTKTYNHAVATADDSWKDLEEDVAAALNKVPTIKDARRSRASGALWFEKGDIVDDILHPECKERMGRELKSGEKSISIQRGWLEKAKEECRSSEKIMVLPFRFKEDTNIYGIFDFDDIATLVTMMKAYMADNDIKVKEMEVLQKKIQVLEERLKKYEP